MPNNFKRGVNVFRESNLNARYIEPNVSWYATYFRGNRGVSRVWREPISWILKKIFFEVLF